MLTIGGNDLLSGLITDAGPGVDRFAQALDSFLRDLPIGPVYLGNVYDPSFGNDANNFLGVDPAIARTNHRRVNQVIAELAGKYGALVDLHAHFLKSGFELVDLGSQNGTCVNGHPLAKDRPLPRCPELSQAAPVSLAQPLRDDQRSHLLPDHLFRGIPKQLFRGRIELENLAFLVDRDDRVQ